MYDIVFDKARVRSHQVGSFGAKSMPIGSDRYGLDKIRALNNNSST